MGKINVVRPDGTVVAVDEDTYRAAQGQPGVGPAEGAPEEVARHTQENQRNFVQGPAFAGLAAFQGLADTATFGLYGKAAELIAPDAAAQGRLIAQEHPTAYGLGEGAALLSPTGLFGDAAKAAGELSAVGGAAKAGEAITHATGSRALGRVGEGALIGTGAYVAQTNVTGDPLTIDGAVEAAGVGGLLNFGIGLVGDKLTNVGKRAQEASAKVSDLQKSVVTAKEGAPLLEAGPVDSHWNNFKTTFEAQQASERKVVGEYQRAGEKYEKWTSSNKKLTTAAKTTENVLYEIEDRYSPLTPEVERKATLSSTKSDAIGKTENFRQATAPGDIPIGTPQRTGELSRDVSDKYNVKYSERATVDLNKPQISPELKADLDGYQSRISDIYKKKGGGWRLNGDGKWIRDASVKADAAGAAEDLRALNTELEQRFPKASGKLAEIPQKPPEFDISSMSDEVALPSTPRGFAQMRKDTIAKLANAMGPDSQEAFAKFTNELGLQPLETAGATADAVHSKLNEYIKAASDVKSALADGGTEDGGGILGWARKNAKKAAKYAIARSADVGGFAGAFTRTAAGETASYAMDAFEKQMLDAKLLEGKLTAQSKTRDLIGRWATKGGKIVDELGPVEAYLHTSFPSGEQDGESDPRKAAANRIKELTNQTITAPDSLFAAVEGMLGHTGDVGWKIHQKIVQGLQYLQQMAPKDPGTDFKLMQSNWAPEWEAASEFAHRMEAFLNPFNAIARQLSGDGHPAAADSLWQHWPGLMDEVSQEFASNIDGLKKFGYAQLAGAGRLFRTNLTGLQDPDTVIAIQGLYMPQETAGPTTGKPGFGKQSHGVPGRPAAVQSPVAGSSVSGLISQ